MSGGRSSSKPPRPTAERQRALCLQAEVLQAIRGFFRRQKFLEVNTPLLAQGADPALHVDSLQTLVRLPTGERRPYYLPTSPELFMKRLVVEGFVNIFQVSPFFRDGEWGPLHRPQFIGLEWYQLGGHLDALMATAENLVRNVVRRLRRRRLLAPDASVFGRRRPFHRLTIHQACSTLGRVDLPEDFEYSGVKQALEKSGVRTATDDRLDDLLHRLLLERVEPRLAEMGGVFLYHYPAEMAALASLCPQRPWLAERFELYLAGVEIANGYHELSDANEQRRRFQEQLQERKRLGLACPQLDDQFLRAMDRGLPDCCGCALGVDRLTMVLGGYRSLEECLAFPAGC